MTKVRYIIIGISVAIAGGCKSYTSGNTYSDSYTYFHGEPSEYRVIRQDIFGGLELENTLVLKDQHALDSIYSELGLQPIPLVNFAKYDVLAIFMGRQPSAGYTVTVEQVRTDADTVDVYLEYKYPGTTGIVIEKDSIGEIGIVNKKDDTMATPTPTSPYCIAIMPKRKGIRYVTSN